MLVLDAAVLVAYFTDRARLGPRATERVTAEHRGLSAPHLIDAEVGSALRRLAAQGGLDPVKAQASLIDLANLPIQRYPHTWLLDRAWALRENLSFYDALYVALAQELEVGLLTLDARLARAAEKVAVEVELL